MDGVSGSTVSVHKGSVRRATKGGGIEGGDGRVQ